MPKRKLNLSDTIVSLIIVAHNDEDILVPRLQEVKKVLSRLRINYELVVIDNNSDDKTVEKIKRVPALMRNARILILSKNYDTSIALSAGLDNCIGDYALLFNLYTSPSKVISDFIHKLIEGHDVVIGKAKQPTVIYTTFSRFILWAVKKFSRHGFDYEQHSLIGIGRRAINSIIRTRRKSRNLSYIHSLIGFRKATIEYKPLRRYQRKIKPLNFLQLLITIMDTAISNSFRPIRIVSLAGMAFSLLFLIYVLVIVILVFVFGMKHIAPQGWITVSTVLGTMFFLIFSLLGIISEYIIRILGETRDEPFYFVSEEINKSSILPKKKRTLNIV